MEILATKQTENEVVQEDQVTFFHALLKNPFTAEVAENGRGVRKEQLGDLCCFSWCSRRYWVALLECATCPDAP